MTQITKANKMLLLSAILFIFMQPSMTSAQLNFDEKWAIENWWEMYHYNMKDFVRFSPNNNSIFFPADTGYNTAGSSHTASKVFQISTETGEMISCSENTDEIYEFDISPLGNIYVTLQSKGLTIRDAKTHRILFTYLNHTYNESYISNVLISPDEKYLIFNQGTKISDYPDYKYESSVIVYNIESEKIIKTIPSINIDKWRFSANGKTIAAKVYLPNNSDGLYLFNTTDWNWTVIKDIAGIREITYSGDGVCVAVSSSLGCFVINTETMEIKKHQEQEVFGAPEYIIFLQDHDNYIVRYYDGSNVEYKNDLIVQRYYCDYEIIESNLFNNQFQMFAHIGAKYMLLTPKVTGVIENDKATVSIVYANNSLKLVNDGLDYNDAELYVCDIRGNIVHAEQFQLGSGYEHLINMNFHSGVYFYRVVCGLRSFTGKFEVAR